MKDRDFPDPMRKNSYSMFHSATPAPRAGRRRRGFTLVEVLATVMLLTIVFPVFWRANLFFGGVASVTHRRTDAAALADSKLNELLAQVTTLPSSTAGVAASSATYQSPASLQGNFGDDWPDYSWTAKLGPWSNGTNSTGQTGNSNNLAVLQQLDVTVTWTDRQGAESLTVSTLFYQSPNLNGATP